MDLKISNTILKVLLLIGAVAIVLAIGYGVITKNKYDSRILELQNLLSEKTSTVEVQKNLYEKLSLKTKNLEDLLTSKDQEIQELKKTIEQNNQDILALTSLVVTWKKAYEDEAHAHQSDVESSNGIRTKVEFDKDFGAVKVSGYTLTNPAYAWLKVEQGRPLKLTLAITQDKNLLWHSYVTSSDDNMQIDISLSGVSPYVLDRKWFEKIGVTGLLAIGSSDTGIGSLMGIGINYTISQFNVGPMVMVGVSNRIDKFLGINLTWNPFMR